MKKRLYLRLALQNLKRNRQTVLPYALSCIGAVLMCFIMFSLAYTSSLQNITGAQVIQQTLFFGVFVLILFSIIFLFYTNSFLVKRRRKEFGLLNTLGMEKKHLAKMLFIENSVIALLTTAAGMLLGVLLCQLMFLLLVRVVGIMHLNRLSIPASVWYVVPAVFSVIHFLTYLNSLKTVHLNKPIELLKGESPGEKEPKNNLYLWTLAALALLCLGSGYAISLVVKDAVRSISYFFVAVILIIMGTYALFSALSITVLRALRRSKHFYYQPQNFSVIAGMIHRMRRNAVGLATICILSTMTLVMVSVVASLYAAKDRDLQKRFPRNTIIKVEPVKTEAGAKAVLSAVRDEVKKQGSELGQLIALRSLRLVVHLDQDTQSYSPTVSSQNLSSSGKQTYLNVLAYEKVQSLIPKAPTLRPGEALIFSKGEGTLLKYFAWAGSKLSLKENKDLASIAQYSLRLDQNPSLLMQQADMDKLISSLMKMDSTGKGLELQDADFSYHLLFDSSLSSPEKTESMIKAIRTRVSDLLLADNVTSSFYSANRASAEAGFNTFFGGLLFVALFLGLLFTMAMILIIYYKQISEGLEDRRRFLIMQQVGMSQTEVKSSIKRQVLLVFFLPLLMAGLHLGFSLNITYQIFQDLLAEQFFFYALVALICYAVFAVFYIFVYLKTAGAYYRLVRQQSA